MEEMEKRLNGEDINSKYRTTHAWPFNFREILAWFNNNYRGLIIILIPPIVFFLLGCIKCF